MTTSNDHLNGAGILVALGIMGGGLVALCVLYLAADWFTSKRRRQR